MLEGRLIKQDAAQPPAGGRIVVGERVLPPYQIEQQHHCRQRMFNIHISTFISMLLPGRPRPARRKPPSFRLFYADRSIPTDILPFSPYFLRISTSFKMATKAGSETKKILKPVVKSEAVGDSIAYIACMNSRSWIINAQDPNKKQTTVARIFNGSVDVDRNVLATIQNTRGVAAKGNHFAGMSCNTKEAMTEGTTPFPY